MKTIGKRKEVVELDAKELDEKLFNLRNDLGRIREFQWDIKKIYPTISEEIKIFMDRVTKDLKELELLIPV